MKTWVINQCAIKSIHNNVYDHDYAKNMNYKNAAMGYGFIKLFAVAIDVFHFNVCKIEADAMINLYLLLTFGDEDTLPQSLEG